MIGQIEAGNRVDVYAGFNVIPLDRAGQPINGGQARPMLRLIMSDVPVVAVGEKASTGSGSTNVSLKVDDEKAAQLAFASDNGKVWLALRPSAGACRVPSRPGHDRDHAAGRPAGEGAAVGRRQPVNAQGLRIFVALESSLDSGTIRSAFPAGVPVRLVSLADAHDRTAVELQEAADLVVVGCAEEREEALELIGNAARQRATGRSSRSTAAPRTGSSSVRSRRARTI